MVISITGRAIMQSGDAKWAPQYVSHSQHVLVCIELLPVSAVLLLHHKVVLAVELAGQRNTLRHPDRRACPE